MKIYIVRHAKVNMKWPPNCDSNEFDTACMIYNRSDIKKISNTKLNIPNDNIYVSGMKRSIRTAQILFPTSKYHIVSSISEVPLKSFTDTTATFPLWVWNIIGRVQWFFNSSRQDEKRKAKSVLSAAAMTYVAAAASSIIQLLRLIILFGGRNNDRD